MPDIDRPLGEGQLRCLCGGVMCPYGDTDTDSLVRWGMGGYVCDDCGLDTAEPGYARLKEKIERMQKAEGALQALLDAGRPMQEIFKYDVDERNAIRHRFWLALELAATVLAAKENHDG